MPTSPDTLLRILHSMSEGDNERGPRVLGVDDVALRCKQRRYGTLLIGLETHRPIDLPTIAPPMCLPTGCAVTLASRSSSATVLGRTPKAVWQGAPDAIQVADRFHLSANAGAALDEVLRSRRRHIEYVVVAEPVPYEGPTPTAPVPPSSQTQQELALRRGRRSARWDEVRRLRVAGYGHPTHRP